MDGITMTQYLTPDDVADRCDKVRRSGNGYMAQCPIHEDRLPSLKISIGKKGTLVYCHAGCKVRDVLAALNIEPQMLFYDYASSGPVQRDINLELKSLIARTTPVDIWEPYTLGEVMREAFHQGNPLLGVEPWCRAYVEYGDLMDMPFAPGYRHFSVTEEGQTEVEVGAFELWHVVADGPVFEYMRDWLPKSGCKWNEVRAEAMTVLHTYWKRRVRA
jgi:hypothetical protein